MISSPSIQVFNKTLCKFLLKIYTKKHTQNTTRSKQNNIHQELVTMVHTKQANKQQRPKTKQQRHYLMLKEQKHVFDAYDAGDNYLTVAIDACDDYLTVLFQYTTRYQNKLHTTWLTMKLGA